MYFRHILTLCACWTESRILVKSRNLWGIFRKRWWQRDFPSGRSFIVLHQCRQPLYNLQRTLWRSHNIQSVQSSHDFIFETDQNKQPETCSSALIQVARRMNVWVVVTKESAGGNEAPLGEERRRIRISRSLWWSQEREVICVFTLRCFSKASGFGAHSVQTW